MAGQIDMGKIILFHGTADKDVNPTFGRGDDKHDYGRGFYLTESLELAKEVAGLKILDFQEKDVLAWLAELMKHRDAADSKRL